MWSGRHPKLRVHTVVAILSIEVAATVSFSADCVRFGDRLGDLVETGVAVKDAAAAVGVSGMSVLCCPACPGAPHGCVTVSAGSGRSRADRGGVHRDGLDQGGHDDLLSPERPVGPA